MVESPHLKTPTRERFFWLAPALVGIYPALAVYLESVKDSSVINAVTCGLVLMVAAMSLAYVFRMVFSDGTRASLGAVVFVVWAFGYSGYLRAGRLLLERLTLSPL